MYPLHERKLLATRVDDEVSLIVRAQKALFPALQRILALLSQRHERRAERYLMEC